MFQIGMLIAKTIRIFLNSVLADTEFLPRRKVFPRAITTCCVLLAVAVLAVRNVRGESFQLRARVNKIQAEKPVADQTFTISYGGASSKTAGGTWSDWISCCNCGSFAMAWLRVTGSAGLLGTSLQIRSTYG